MEFTPKLDILPATQQALWPELADTPAEFTLYGGTAIALYLGHRQSVDFDFFGTAPFNPQELYQKIPYLAGSHIIQQQANTLTCLVDRDGPVKLSFFGVPGFPSIKPYLQTNDTRLPVASLVDLGGTKAAVVQQRAEYKDYVDLDALIQQANIPLITCLAAGAILYGASFNPDITLKALTFYQDGTAGQVPADSRQRLIEAVKMVDMNTLPSAIRALSDGGTI